MEGEEQTTISPEFLENIQSAVNSQGVLGQVQVIQTENGPVTVLFMEEGADTSNIGSDNITLTVSDGNLVDAGIEDQNSQVQFQYQVQPDEDYTQFLQSGNAEIVSTTETVKDVAASVEPVIGISEQGTVESAQEKGAESNDTYFITDTGEILKIDSSLLGDSGETFQLQTQDGTYQVLNQLGSVQTSSSNDTQARYSQPVIENTNVTFKESAPFEYTATKVEAPLVIDTSRVEEPKVLSYKTTNRQRTNIMRQPVSKPSPVNFQSKPVVTNQNVKTQTSLLSNAHYKTVKQVDRRSKTTEIVYPKSYQKQTLVFPKVQKQAQQGSVIKTDQAGYQPQMITTVVNPQSLLKPGVDQSFSVGQALKKFNTSQIQGSSMTTQSLYAKKPMPEVNKFTSQVVSRQIPAVTKQQTDLLSVAMKQAEVPEQVLSSIPTVPKKILEPVVKDLVPANHLGDKALSEKLQGVKGSLQDIAVAKPLQEITPDPVSFAGAVPVMEKQSSTEQQTVLQPAAEITSGVATVTEKVSPAVENAVSQTDGLDESEMETDAWQQIEDNQLKVDQKAADQMTDKLEVSETGTSQNQVDISSAHDTEKLIILNLDDAGYVSVGEVWGIEILKLNESVGMSESKHSEEIYMVDENDANKIKFFSDRNKKGKSKHPKKEKHLVKKSLQKSAAKVKLRESQLGSGGKITEKVVFSSRRSNFRVRSLLKCALCEFTTSKKWKLEKHTVEHDNAQTGAHEQAEQLPLDNCLNQLQLHNCITYERCLLTIPKSDYNSHVLEMHPLVVFECETCKKTFPTLESLKKHKAVLKSNCSDNRKISGIESDKQRTDQKSTVGNKSQKQLKERRSEMQTVLESVSNDREWSSCHDMNLDKVDIRNEKQIFGQMIEKDGAERKRVKQEKVSFLESARISFLKRRKMYSVDKETEKSISEQEKQVKSDVRKMPEALRGNLFSRNEEEDDEISPSSLYETDESSSEAETIEISDSASDTSSCEVEIPGTELSNTNKHFDKYSSFETVRNGNNEDLKDLPQPVVVLERLDGCETGKRVCVEKVKTGEFVFEKHAKRVRFSSKDDLIERTCVFCAKRIFGRDRLCRHLRQVHTGPFKCPTCKAAFKKKVDYNAHRKVHKEEWLGKWREICDSEPEINVLARMTKYKGRKLMGKTKTVKPGKCNICNRTFAALRALMLHKKLVHRTKAKDVDRLHYKVFAVSELSVKEKEALSFKKNSFQFENFQAEDMNESETVEKMLDNKGNNVNIDSLRTVFQCDFCKQCFISEEEVLAHVKIHQTVCSVCKCILHDYTSLQKHRVFSHANVEGANFPCVKCKKMFITQGDLHYHLKIHDGPWICEYTACKAVFSEKENFDKHIAMHQEEKFVCVCERRFMKEEDLKRHVRTKKGKCQPPQKPVEGSEPVLDIPVSEVNSYIDKGVDIVIEGKGTIIAPFKCKICSAQFVSHSFTKRHILLRHCKNVEERQLRCSICGFKSNCSDGMKTHLKNHDQSVSETGGEICENDDDTDNSETIKNSIEDILNINQTREIDRPASNNENNKIVKDSQQLQGELDNAVENDSSKNGNCNASDEISENVTVFHDRSDSVLSVEKVQIQTDVTLNEMSQPTMDIVELHPPQTLQPQDPGPLSPQEAYDDLVEQIGTILTEEVWSTAQIKDRSSSLIQEKQNHNIFEYKGMVPEGLESYIPTVGPYVCSGCGVPCDGQDKFKCHVLTHHTEGLLCKLCKKKPTSSKNLLGHMIDKHLEGKPLTCPKCGGAFKKLNFYWRHAKAHTVSHVCEFCKKQFNRKSDLTEHLHSHVEQKQFCVRCGETFDTADQLRMHTWKAHNIILHKNKNRRKRMRVNTQPNSDKISKGHTICICLEKVCKL